MASYRTLFVDIPAFGRLWASRFVVGIAASLQWVALLWLGSRSPTAATSTAIIVFALTTPAALLGPVVGIVVDRFNRQQLLVYTSIAQAMLAISIPFAFTAFGLVPAVAIAFVQSFFAVVFSSAYGASLPEIVDDKRLPMANGINQTGLYIGNVVGAATGGLLVETTTLATPYFVVGAAFAVAAIVATQLPSLMPGSREPKRSAPESKDPVPQTPDASTRRDRTFGQQFSQGWRHWKGNPRLVWFTVVGVIAVIGFAPAPVALVVLVSDGLGAKSSVYGMLQSIITVGLAVGAVAVGRWTLGLHRGTTMAIGYVAMGIATASLAFAPTVAYAAAVVLLRSASNSIVSVPGASLLQTAAPNEVRGRVLTLVGALQEIPRALIVPLSGVVIDRIGVHTTYLVMGGFIAAAGIVAFLTRFVIDPPVTPTSVPKVSGQAQV